jgi:hypothetical protein
VAGLGDGPPIRVGEAAFFSAAGPNALGGVKPDVIAPGAFVVGALSVAADPRSGRPSVFSGGGFCSGLGCQVLSDTHAVTAGTSMAAPLVSGAVALLLERDPALDQAALRGLLQSGAAALETLPEPASRQGGGVVDLVRSFDALGTSPRASSERPQAARSRLRLARARAFADPDRSVAALLQLSAADGGVFDADPSRLSVAVGQGEAGPLSRSAPGLYAFRLWARPEARGEISVDVLFDDEPLLGSVLPLDEPAPRAGRRVASGGCVVAPARGRPLGWTWLLGAALLLPWRRRRAPPSPLQISAR